MAARDYTTTGLLAAIKRSAWLPDAAAEGPYTDAELLAKGDEATDAHILPALQGARTNHYVTADDDITPVANQPQYRVPPRAVGGVLRLVVWLDNSGNGVPMSWEGLDTVDVFGAARFALGEPPTFTVMGDQVVLMPPPASSSGTLRLYYYPRPGRLIPTSEAMQITAINTTTGVLDGNAPTAWTTSDSYDIVSNFPTFQTLKFDLTPDAVTSGTSVEIDPLDFPEAPLELAEEDWVTLSHETPIPQIPPELHKALALFVAADCLEDMGDPRWQGKIAKAQRVLDNGINLLSPRVQGQARVVINRHSPLRSSRGRFGGRLF